MKHHGCDESAIIAMQTTPNQKPRKDPNDYEVITVPDEYKDKIYSWDEVIASNGLNETALRYVINGKVMEFRAPDGISDDVVIKRRAQDIERAGTDITNWAPKMLYEPKYGICTSVECMSEEFRAYSEDLYILYNTNPPMYYHCVGVVSPSQKP